MKAIVEDDRRKKRALERARKDAAAAGKRKRKEDAGAGDKGGGSVFTDADFEVGGLKLENFRHEYVGNKDCRVSLN